MVMSLFNRPVLANKFAERIASDKGASGTFIAALRRTGKSTFIREDLIPVLEQNGAKVIYVDLWANKLADPGDLIAGAIRDHLHKQAGVIAQFARKAGLEKVTIGGLQLNLDKIGTGVGDTLSKALEALSQETKSLIVMVIDEAQHAQTTENGSAALYALKAARDELNSTKHYGFRLVATGSNRDKLAILVQGKEQAFLHAKLVDLPNLGDDYLHWKMRSFAGDAKPSFGALKDAFERCTHRPEVLNDVLDDMELLETLNVDNVDEILDGMVQKSIQQARNSFFSMFKSLEPLQSALMQTMASQRADFAPFTEKTYDACRALCRERTKEEVKIDSSSVGYALDLLRKYLLVWKSGRGVYSIEDTQHIAWLSGVPEESLNAPVQFGINEIMERTAVGNTKLAESNGMNAADEEILHADIKAAVSDVCEVDVVKDGCHSGKILDIDNNIVIQKTGRNGETAKHLLSRLSSLVVIGEVVEIHYKDGVGQVGKVAVEVDKGR